MRRAWVLIVGMLVIVGFVAEWMVTQLTLADFAQHPVVGLARTASDDTYLERLALREEDDIFGDQAEGTVRFVEARGVPLGQRYVYRVPGGRDVVCTHLWRWIWCEGEWQPIRG